MRKCDLSLRSSTSSDFATFRHQLTILSKTDALDEEKWLNLLGTSVKSWFRCESRLVRGRDSLVAMPFLVSTSPFPRISSRVGARKLADRISKSLTSATRGCKTDAAPEPPRL